MIYGMHSTFHVNLKQSILLADGSLGIKRQRDRESDRETEHLEMASVMDYYGPL